MNKMILLNSDATSDFGCNISTGIIVEKLNEAGIKNKHLLFNAKTMYRNFINCLDGNAEEKIKMLKDKTSLNNIYNMFLTDTTKFAEACFTVAIDIHIYVPDYKKVYNDWANFREVEDFKGLKHFILITEDQACNLLLEKNKGITFKTTHILPYYENSFIATHIGMDLLNFVNKKVSLIESNTGVIKDSSLWYTKYSKIGTKSMAIFPFNKLLYFILGDATLIKPQNIKFRSLLYKLALQLHWRPQATPVNIIASIKMKDPSIGKILADLLPKVKF